MRNLEGSFLLAGAEIARLAIWLALLSLAFVPLERLLALQRRKLFRPGLAIDLSYYFLNGLVIRFVLAIPMAAIAWGLHFVTPSALHAWVANWPLVARLAAALVVGEVGFYWGHRWTHASPLLWRFHLIHHSAEHVDWLVNTRAHPVDIVFTRLCGFVPLYALGLAQLALGAQDAVPALVVVIGSLWGFFIHSNVRCRLGWLGWAVSTPAFHHWHHANDGGRDINFASMLPVLDRMFGTHHLPRGGWPKQYGADAGMATGLGGQLMQPLLPRKGLSRAEPTLLGR